MLSDPLSARQSRCQTCVAYPPVVLAAAHGIPWRRGYLFYGPPGAGKTSLVTALAGRLHKSIYVINLSSPAMNDEVRAGLACLGTR